MKKFKLIVPSFLAVIFCMLLIAGSTYAIFSSQSESSIAVTSGNIDVHANLSIEKMYTIQANDGIGTNDSSYAGTKTIDNGTHKYEYVLTGSYEGQAADTKIYKMFALTSNNNSLGGANVTNSTLNLMNIAPGSKVELKLDAQNQSTIGIKYRLAIYATPTADAEMLSQMKLSFSSKKVGIGSKSFTGLNSYKTGWVEQAANVDVDDVTIIIELPLSASATGKSAGYSIVFESIQGNAKTNEVFDLVNKKLNESTDVINNTMYDAYQEALAIDGVDATNFSIANYLWNSVTDQFVLDTDVPASVAYQYFKVYESMPSTQKYSIYAADTWSNTTVSDLKVGFDVGNTSKITSINYDRSAASTGRTVIIRTNGGSLTINAPLDTVQHYGTVSSLNIIAVAGSSYHEYGSVGFAEIKTGRIVLEKESEVSQIHLTATDGSFNNIVVAKESTVDMPDFSRDFVEIAENGKLVVALQDGINEDTEKEYIWLTSLGLYEQVTVSSSDAIAGENFVTGSSDVEQKSAAQQIANNIVVNNGQYSVKATKVGANWSYDVVNDTSTTVSGYTVTESAGNITITYNNEQVLYNTENGMTASEKTTAVNKYNNCEARIGNTYYDTLEAAITAANLSETALTITVLKDFQKSGSYVINNSLNIDGENHIVTATGTATSGNMATFDMVDLAANAQIAINVKDLTINATRYARVFLLNGDYSEYTNPNVLNAANLNITTDGEAFYSNGPSKINVRNCTIIHSGQYLSGKDPVYYSALVVGYNGTLNVYDSTISSFGNGAATFPSGGTINLYNTNITAFNDFVDSSTGYLFWARHEKSYDDGKYTDYCGSSIINVYGGNYVGPYKVTDDGQTALNRIAQINIYAGTFSVNPSDYLADTSDVKSENEVWTVINALVVGGDNVEVPNDDDDNE